MVLTHTGWDAKDKLAWESGKGNPVPKAVFLHSLGLLSVSILRQYLPPSYRLTFIWLEVSWHSSYSASTSLREAQLDLAGSQCGRPILITCHLRTGTYLRSTHQRFLMASISFQRRDRGLQNQYTLHPQSPPHPLRFGLEDPHLLGPLASPQVG